MNEPCFWCSADPNAKMQNDISPHSTWCPHYRSPPWPRLPIVGAATKRQEMLGLPVSAEIDAIVRRVTNQIAFSLKDWGYYITHDTDGNFNVEVLPYEAVLKKERVSDGLRRVINLRRSRDELVTEIRIDDDQARKLAAELAELQLHPSSMTEAEVYASLLAGGTKFLDCTITVIR